MSDALQKQLSTFITIFVRAALIAIAAKLANIIPKAWIDFLVSDLGAGQVSGVVLGLVVLGWSWWSKRHADKRTAVALILPAGATEATLSAAVKATPGIGPPSVPTDPAVIAKITGSGTTPLPPVIGILLLCLALSSGVALTGCAHNSAGEPIVVNSSITQRDAKRALIQVQDARVAALKVMAAVYVARPNDPRIVEAAKLCERYDNLFRKEWAAAAQAVDAWAVEIFLLHYGQTRAAVDAIQSTAAEVK